MTDWIYPDDFDRWARLLEGFGVSAFRLETLQTYDSPGEAEMVARFRAGKPHGGDTSWWRSLSERHRSAGHKMSRVRVVTEPLTDYTRLSLVVFPEFVEAGEDVRIIYAPAEWPSGIPQHDFWLFDDEDLWLMHYTAENKYIGAEHIQDREAVDRHRRWRDLALARSMPLSSYLSTTRKAS
ncbi:MAG: hypothetical protein J2P19_01785 [Pseudonocardia sp.]|nr:hypothetical protein [Pseudonocardia sp.]